ncbi:hypothetical protein EON65_52360 [archaeon]|nr:MAG: hypothetical protein EON65_52360 [archaeon]
MSYTPILHNHLIGVLTIYAYIYPYSGEKSKALHYLRRVLDVHPWAANIPTVLLTVQHKKGGEEDAEGQVV